MTSSTLPPLVSGPVQRAQKVLIYGPEGVGKTTLAAAFPSPLFIDVEGGTSHLDVPRYTCETWPQVQAVVEAVVRGDAICQTLVVDTADWLEKLASAHITQKSHKESLEDFGYGKGYVMLAEEIKAMLDRLDAVLRGGIHVVMLAHSTIRKFERPDQAGAYDRYELKMSKQVAPLLKEWADMMLFCNFWVDVSKDKATGKARATGGKERVIYTEHSPAWDAKNRHGLPEALNMQWAEIEHCFPIPQSHVTSRAATVAPAAKAAKAPIQSHVTATEPPPAEDGSTCYEQTLAEILGPDVAVVTLYLTRIGWLTNGQTLADLKPEHETSARRKLAALVTKAKASEK
jgi:DNA polymerase III delta prime subunit